MTALRNDSKFGDTFSHFDADDVCGRQMDRQHTETDRRTGMHCACMWGNASRNGVVNSDLDTT